LCFVYSDEHQPYFIYPSLLEENVHPACVVEVGLETSFLPIEKNEVYISIPPEHTQPRDHENHKSDSNPSQISLSSVIIEPCHQLVNTHVHPTSFQTRIKINIFKPLKLPYILHPYPLDCLEYLPCFSGEDHVTAERHLGAFENFVDQFEIVHDDVTTRLFSKYLFRDVAVWFKSLRVDSIGSWIELSNTFLKHWGENKSLDLYLADFYALRREDGKVVFVFNRKLYNIYHDIPLGIWPTKTVAMVYYIMAQHSELVLLLLERKSSSLACLFEDAQEIEENICASKRVIDPTYFENMHAREQGNCHYVSVFEHEGSEYEEDLEQHQGCKYISDSDQNSSVLEDVSMDRYAWKVDDQFSNHFDHEVIDDCIGNYMFLADNDQYDLNHVLSSSCDHHFEEKVVATNDQNLITRRLEGYQFSSKDVVMDEQFFSIDQDIFYLGLKDPFAALLGSYFSSYQNISYYIYSPSLTGEFCFLKGFLLLLLYFRHYLLISGMDKIISVLKLLEWLIWKSAFT
jgi:hypothetical protein